MSVHPREMCNSCLPVSEHLWQAEHLIEQLKFNYDDKKHPRRREGIMREAQVHLLAVLAINSMPGDSHEHGQ